MITLQDVGREDLALRDEAVLRNIANLQARLGNPCCSIGQKKCWEFHLQRAEMARDRIVGEILALIAG